LDLGHYPFLLSRLEAGLHADMAQQVMEDFIVTECRLVMNKVQFISEFDRLLREATKLFVAVEEETPSVYLDIRAE
jgi:hypothetical protein